MSPFEKLRFHIHCRTNCYLQYSCLFHLTPHKNSSLLVIQDTYSGNLIVQSNHLHHPSIFWILGHINLLENVAVDLAIRESLLSRTISDPSATFAYDLKNVYRSHPIYFYLSRVTLFTSFLLLTTDSPLLSYLCRTLIQPILSFNASAYFFTLYHPIQHQSMPGHVNRSKYDAIDLVAKESPLSRKISDYLSTLAYNFKNFYHSLILASWFKFWIFESHKKLRVIKKYQSPCLSVTDLRVMKKPFSHASESVTLILPTPISSVVCLSPSFELVLPRRRVRTTPRFLLCS